MKLSRFSVVTAALLLTSAGFVLAQLGGMAMQEWSTSGGDAQRSHWIRKDTLISAAGMASGKFGFLWKLKVNNQPRQQHTFSRPVLVGNAMGYLGFRSLVVLAGASNTVFAVDNDFGVMYWEKHFDATLPTESTAACPGGMTAAATRATNPDPTAFGNRGGANRSPFKSALSEPGAGASVDSPAGRGNAAAGRGAAANATAAPGRGGGRGRGLTFGTGAQPIMVLSGDGVLHFVSPVTAKELLKPVPFVPANANATDLAAVNGTVYTATINQCAGVPNAIWAVDPTSETPEVHSWKTNGGSVVGTMAFGGDGTIYAAIGDAKTGDGGYANAVVALDPATLKVKDWFTLPGAGFVSTPVIFVSKGKEFLAEASGDGRIFLLDAASLGGGDHRTSLAVTKSSGHTSVAAQALASWEDETGTRWLLAPSAGNGSVPNGAIAAYKFASGAKPGLQPAWVSRDMRSPQTPIIVNGVIYAAAGGDSSSPAVLYALEADTGKEIWSSGKTITSFVHGTGLSASPGQVYVVTADNTVYAFGMPYERQ